MHYNHISFPDLKPLSFINDLINKTDIYPYIALIQYDDIIDWYQLKDISKSTLDQLSYYLYIAYDMRSFNSNNVKVIRIDQGNDPLHTSIIDRMNSNNSLLVYDDMMDHST